MKILVLSKRQYMAKDLLDDRFGRFRELPLELSRLGHQVTGICLSYRSKAEGWSTDAAADWNVRWLSLNLGRTVFPGIKRYLSEAERFAADFQPDLIWSCSDAFHAIFGSRLARRTRTLAVVDLYDNFEAFRGTQIPGVLPLFTRAVRQAAGITVVSRRLGNYVAENYGCAQPLAVIESGVRSSFRPQHQIDCRRRLGLPENARIIGTAGALYRSRGIETLFDAFEQLSGGEELHLALAGPRERDLKFPKSSRIHDFNQLPHEEVPVFINTLDVAVVCYRHSAQGEVSFPQKAYEIIACGVPMIAADVGSMNELLQGHPECLYTAGDARSLAAAARLQLERKIAVDVKAPLWSDSGRRLAEFFQAVTVRDAHPAPAFL